MNKWEVVIGLEVHVQLNTVTKLFSSAPNRFGDEPNVNISFLDTAQPGTLPVLNKEAVKKAVEFGLAVEGKIATFSRFDRKSYFYPDSPRNFQITQFSHPIVIGGKVVIDVEGSTKTIAIDRAHLEDDAGMLKHFSSFAAVDYNRAGVPLIEIVSKPCLSSPKEAVAYVKALKSILEYINVSDCNMEQGSLRIDANISVKPLGETKLRNKAEIKNMNSFFFLEAALESEILRQVTLYEKHPDEDPSNVVLPGTYRFDVDSKQTKLMRMKEEAHGYRYFPEPDLLPIVLTEEYIAKVQKTLPELPLARKQRYIDTLHLSEYAASILILDKPTADYFETALATCKNAKALCNWITIEFAGRLKEIGCPLVSYGIPPHHLSNLVNLIDENKITGKIAKQIADDMVKSPGKDPLLIREENPNYQPMNSSEEITPIIEKVLQENPQSILDYQAGKKKAFGFLIGQIMQASEGKASPSLVNELLHKKLDSNS